MQLADRVALIVGAGNGLGRAIADAYRREGCRVACADIDEAAARATAARPGASDACALRCDIADPASSALAVHAAEERFGRLDIVVNCAAICLVDPLVDVTPERWDRVFAVNARGAFFLLQAAGRRLMARGGGRIITVSTPASRLGFPLFASYGASKAVVDSITRSAALAFAPHGVTVNTLVPGRMTGGMIDALEQDLTRVTGVDQAKLAEERTKQLPMRRRVAPEEVAEAAVWLASDRAAYVTAERFNFTGAMEVA